ncbi:MAG TPA: nucleotide sugar dehydrogenase [Dehalococcoidia bacterium]|nr:nucleotide sugar dehydrogenase [Dehalococcoidia bacterium]
MVYNLSGTDIEARISRRDVSIGFIGLGRVGLPLAATLAGEGFQVLGVDINENTVSIINSGSSPVTDENGLSELIHRVVSQGTLKATLTLQDAAQCDVYIIAVPTLITGEEPDIGPVIGVSHQLAKIMTPGKLVVLQSTVPPGTTQNTLGSIIQQESGLIPGTDFGLAYSPERTQAPQVLRDLRTYPKIVGAIDSKSRMILSLIYATFAPGIMSMSNLVTAELDKVVENTYRDVNIAFANELAQICSIYGVDVQELIDTANSQPYCHILQPGLVGGHCIPMDPYYIISDLTRRNYAPRLIKTARDLNNSVFQYVVDMLGETVKRVTVLGLSFKKDIKSFETSHTLKLVELLERNNKEVVVHDPYLTDEVFPFEVDTDIYKSCREADAVIISTAHSVYNSLDFNKLGSIMNGRVIIDVRNILDPAEARRCGFEYHGLGR